MGYKAKMYDSEKREIVEVYVPDETDRTTVGNLYDFLNERKITKKTLKGLVEKFEISEWLAKILMEKYENGELFCALLGVDRNGVAVV